MLKAKIKKKNNLSQLELTFQTITLYNASKQNFTQSILNLPNIKEWKKKKKTKTKKKITIKKIRTEINIKRKLTKQSMKFKILREKKKNRPPITHRRSSSYRALPRHVDLTRMIKKTWQNTTFGGWRRP